MSFDIAELAGLSSETLVVNRKRSTDKLSPSPALKEALKLIEQQNKWLKASSHLRSLEALRETWEKLDQLAEYRKRFGQEHWRQSTVGTVSRLYETLQKQYSATSYAKQLYVASKRDLDAFESIRKTALATHLESLAAAGHATWFANSAIEKAMEQVRAVNLHINEAVHGLAIKNHRRSLHTIQVPVIDNMAAAALMQFWGREGITRQLNSLGIDFEALLVGWAADFDEEQAAQESEKHASDPASGLAVRRDGIDWLVNQRNSGFMSLLGLLLSIYQIAAMYLPALLPDKTSDSPHMAQLIDAQKKLAEQVEQLTQEIMKQIEKEDESLPERVVRERMAVIREKPKSSAAVVTKIFPNQVVTVLDEQGKWIRIRYYDFLKEEFYEGWALKKYFSRVGPRRVAQNR